SDGEESKVDPIEQLEMTKRMMNDKLGEYGVEVFSITITNVVLPQKLAQTMEDATTWHAKNEYAKIQQEYEMKVLEDSEKKQQHKQKLKEDREEAQVVSCMFCVVVCFVLCCCVFCFVLFFK